MLKKKYLFIFSLLLLLSSTVMAQVLGPCGSPPKKAAGPPSAPAAPVALMGMHKAMGNMAVKPIPLPGQKAIDFELTAVVGNEIKTIKLSDYSGKWRVLCFYPADFTFV